MLLFHSNKETVHGTTEQKKAWRIIAAYGLQFSLCSLLILVEHLAMDKARNEILTKLAIIYHMSTLNYSPCKQLTPFWTLILKKRKFTYNIYVYKHKTKIKSNPYQGNRISKRRKHNIK